MTKKMVSALVLVVVMMVARIGVPQTAGSLEFQPWYNLGNRGELWEAMACATKRLRVATCLDIDVSVNGPHLVRWGTEDHLPNDSAGYVSGASWSAQAIRLLVGMPSGQACQVLTHEIVHVLRKSYSHPGEQYSMSHTSTSTSRAHIAQSDLDVICAKQTCGCQVPEQDPGMASVDQPAAIPAALQVLDIENASRRALVVQQLPSLVREAAACGRLDGERGCIGCGIGGWRPSVGDCDWIGQAIEGVVGRTSASNGQDQDQKSVHRSHTCSSALFSQQIRPFGATYSSKRWSLRRWMLAGGAFAATGESATMPAD